MNSVRASAPQLADITPYDPKYLPARAYLSANENPCDVETEVRNEIKREINKVAFNRYPDPLANELRDMIAEANGLDRYAVVKPSADMEGQKYVFIIKEFDVVE